MMHVGPRRLLGELAHPPPLTRSQATGTTQSRCPERCRSVVIVGCMTFEVKGDVNSGLR